MDLKSHKMLTAWITVLTYAISLCAFINAGHCCSGHSHPDGQAQDDHDHLPLQASSENIVLSESTSSTDHLLFFQRPCCGQSLQGENHRIALRSTEPSRLVTWFSAGLETGYEQTVCASVEYPINCAVSRACARSPALESILTVSLLI